MSKKEELIQLVMEAKNPEKLIAVLSEAIDMIHQGKSDEEILKHFGVI
jgi:hypothetical protein